MTSNSPADDDAIRALLDRMRDAWARGDALAYADCFTPDSYYVTYNGMCLRGRDENIAVHGPLFQGVLKGTRLSGTVESLNFLAPDVAVVLTAGSGARRRPQNHPPRKSFQTLVIVRRDDQWRIAAFQNTRTRPFSIWLTRQMARSVQHR